MLKEKYQNVKGFVKEHKTDIALGGLAILGTMTIGQQLLINKMIKAHNINVKGITDLGKFVELIGKGLNMANEDIDALAELNGKTIEDVWDIAFNKKYNLNK